MTRDASAGVVTGLGIIAGPVCGAENVAQHSFSGAPMPCSDIDRAAGYHVPGSARRAVLSGDVDVDRWISRLAARRMSTPSKLGVAAARMALDDAGLSDLSDGARIAVVMSGAFGAVKFTERLLRTALTEGPEAVSPFAFTESVANAIAAQIALATGARGTNITVAQREAGVLTAVRLAAAEVAEGRADIALAGGAEEMAPILHALLDRLGALARPGGPGAEVARPFDRRRNGFIAAEGAVVLVIETEARARGRGARVRARIRGGAGRFDPTATRVGWGHGAAELAEAMRRMLAQAHWTPADVGRIVSGASGSVAGDRLEANILTSAWQGEPLPPILTPKSTWGEYGGGFLAAAVSSVSAHEAGPTPGFSEPDVELGIVPHPGGALPSTTRTLVTSLASGGAVSWLLLEAV